MKLKIAAVILVYLLGVVYLFPDGPSTPDLVPSTRSTEEGDTWQNPDQKGFYTDLTRKEVIGQMQTKYTYRLFGFTIPSYRLNYRPEESFEMVRDQMKTTLFQQSYPKTKQFVVGG